MKYLIPLLLLTGCAGTFNTAIHSLPSVQDCQHVSYERIGNIVKISADCAIPLQTSPLLSIPPMP